MLGNYMIVYFGTKEFSESENVKNYIEYQRKVGFKVSVVNQTKSMGRNYEVGIIKYCPLNLLC